MKHQHNWETKIDSLGFVDKRTCLDCYDKQIRSNLPDRQGEWQDNGRDTARLNFDDGFEDEE